jgi:hypothetical protein
MHVKVEMNSTLRTFASVDMAVAKVEDFLGPRLDEMAHQLHWLILPVPVAPDSKEVRYTPVFFAISDEARQLGFTLARHGWKTYG